MDRRDALKKMAAGGATIVGASMVLSSVAFADGGTKNSRPTGTAGGTSPTLTAALTTSKSTRTINTLAVDATPAGACPFGSPTTPRKEFAWSIVAGTTSGTITGTAFGALASATATDVGGPTGSGWSGTFTVRLTIRWVCDQRPTGVTAAWVCQSFAALVTTSTAGGNGSVSIGPTTQDGTPVNCDSPVPLPS